MRILPVLVFCACLALQPFTAKALTDEDHTRYAREFPAYSQAERRLNAAWKRLKQRLSKEEFQALLAEQRVWVNSTRDAEAKAIAGPGPFASAAPLAAAYTEVTVKRAEALEARIRPASPKDVSAAQAAPVKNAATPGTVDPAKSAPAGQTAPSAKNLQTGQAAPVVKSPPAGQAAPVSQGPQAGQAAPTVKGSPAARGASPADKSAPSLQAPDVPLAVSAPEQRGSIVGSYGSGGSLAEVKASGKGYYIAVSTAAPDARWICEMEGIGVLEGDILRVTSVSSGASVAVPIQFTGDSLIIPATRAATCGFGGTIEGVYPKK